VTWKALVISIRFDLLPKRAPKNTGCQRIELDVEKQKTRILTGRGAGFRTFLDSQKHVFGIGGLEQSAKSPMDEGLVVFEKQKYRH
jgi:hypothetical protein